MGTFQITLVSGDPAVREAAARAFDSAPHHWSLDLLEHPPEPETAAELGRIVWGPDVVAPDGAPRFDPDDPASLAGLAPSSSLQSAHVVAVTSVAGGAGVSTFALHLAKSFADLRRRTLFVESAEKSWLIDRLKLPADARSAAAIGDTEESLALSCLPVTGGFKVLLGAPPASPAETPSTEAPPLGAPPAGLPDCVRRAGKIFDRVILDLPATGSVESGGVERGSITGGVLILPPHRTALRRAARFLEDEHGFPWAIVCNRLGSGGALTPQLLAKELGHAVDIGLPCTPALRDAEDHAALLSARYRWTRGVARVAMALDRI